MDSFELNRELLNRFEDLCIYLFPNGEKTGNHFLVGGLDGSKGKSLQITLSGVAAGRFKDFANPDQDKGATPLFLWSKAKGIHYSDAIKQAKEWLGIRDDDFGIKRQHKKEWVMPQPSDRKGTQLVEPNSKATDYLVLERRIDPIVMANARLGESTDGEWVVIPYFDKPDDKEAFHIKKLKVDRIDGKKEMFASKGTRRSLYGWHLIGPDVAEITITEGEFDTLSYHSVGLPALSVPNGVSDFAWVEADWERLEQFERINIHFDMDAAGRPAAEEVCRRLGLHRCYMVSGPHKDANESLQNGCTRDDFLAWLKTAKAIELDEIKRARDYTDEVYEYYSTDWTKRGWETPWWPKLPWRVRKSEFTILSGFSGHGKTIALNQLMLHLVQQGARVMDSSLEIKPGMTLYNMTRCALAKKTASRDEIRCCHEWLNESVFFHDCIGTVTVDRLIHAMEYARKRHGIDVFVVDSLFKCGLSSEDYGGQRAFADRLTTFCNNTGAHVILVAHSRKVQIGHEYKAPSKADVSGSSDLTNAAFNVIIWYRNKLKKHKLDEAKSKTPQDTEQISKWMDEPDGLAILDKQRFGEGDEATVPVWFEYDSLQFHPHKNMRLPYFKLDSKN